MLSLRRLLFPALVIAALVAVPAAGYGQVRHVEGKTGPGSFYEMDVPAVWNGTLVLYAHGIVQADQPLLAPRDQAGYAGFRGALLAYGYAVAASSFSSNGWAVADAVQRTHQLGKLFVSKFGQPTQILLAGHSMGGLAILELAEKYPGQYAGALPMCAPLGGGIAEIRYAGDARLIFDSYFPGLLPGTPFDVPAGTEYIPRPAPAVPGSPLYEEVFEALITNPQKVMQWTQAAGLPFQPGNVPQMFESALYFLGFQLRYTNDLIERVNGKIPYDNWTTEYAVEIADPDTNAGLSAQLNAEVERYLGDPAAFNYYERNYEPTGDIRFPVVTLHNTYDPGVPSWHEQLYAKKVADAGNSAWLTRLSAAGFGHCNFTATDTLTAFNALVTQVNAVAAGGKLEVGSRQQQ
ncbi:MAG: hypothetical protein EHM24_04705 [Acidobacteria bacterium]|nr:MAG: hypothetical protein EHM24_04705 [Acidobacteriota bacterium]